VNYGDSILVIGQSAGQTLRARIPFIHATGIREGGRLRITWRYCDMHFIAV